MDAFSMTYNAQSNRESSKIYQDLVACRQRFHSSESMDSSTLASMKPRVKDPNKNTKICIVGAGLSGLRCADILLQHGFDITILEARDRIGGRVHQITLPSGFPCDLGANWLHGSDEQPLLDIAKETDTELHTWDEKGLWFNEDGNIMADGNARMEEVWSIIHEAFGYSGENSSTIDENKSLYDFIAERLLEAYPDDEERRRTALQFSEIWGTFVGSSVTKQSLKFFWLEECIDGENIFVAGTYKKILASVARAALENAQIHLSTKVSRVETDPEGVTIFTDDGKELEFDEVVMTTPLGWLKNNKQVFQPALPERHLEAIDALGYGCLEKVYITFPKPFWLDPNLDAASQTFDGFTQWLAPKYASATNPNKWHQEIVPMSSFSEANAHPTLLLYIYGDQSRKFASDLAKLPSQKEQDEYLVKFFKPYYSTLPNYSASSPDCTPVSCVATTWVNDELAGYGSYTNFQIGLKRGDEDVEVLRGGLPDRCLWFAGEHTAPFIALGTTTGAYWSGEAVGKRIAQAYGKTTPN